MLKRRGRTWPEGSRGRVGVGRRGGIGFGIRPSRPWREAERKGVGGRRCLVASGVARGERAWARGF